MLSIREQNLIIETLRRNGESATKIHQMLCTAWGDDIIKLRRTQQICKEFAEGRESNDVENDGKLTTRELANKYDLSHQMVFHILKDDLGYRCLRDKWIPHSLNDQQKETRIEKCTEMLSKFSSLRNIKRNLIVTDEKWFFSRPVGNSSTRRSWVGPDGDRQVIAPRKGVEKKFMVMLAINFSAQFYFEVLNTGETVDSERYTLFLDNALQSFNTYELQQSRQSVQWENCIVFHDNAKPHISNYTCNFLNEKQCCVFRQAPYSPDTNICDRMVFPLLEMRRCKIPFNEIDELKNFLNINLSSITPEIMNHEFDLLLADCQRIINNEGCYC